MFHALNGGGIYSTMARKKSSKTPRKRRKARKDAIPMNHVRKPIPRPCPDMGSAKEYKRKQKHKGDWD